MTNHTPIIYIYRYVTLSPQDTTLSLFYPCDNFYFFYYYLKKKNSKPSKRITLPHRQYGQELCLGMIKDHISYICTFFLRNNCKKIITLFLLVKCALYSGAEGGGRGGSDAPLTS
jgi:hypothetical protein